MAFSGSSTATCMCIPKISSRRAMYCSWSTSWRYRSRAVMRCRSKRLNGCVPAEPKRVPPLRAISATYPRSCASAWYASPAVRHTGVVTSRTDCMSSAWRWSTCSPSATAARTESMCWTRSHVSGSRSMYSSSTPSVYGSPFPNRCSSTLAWSPGVLCAPLPVIDGGKICFTGGSIPASRQPDHCFGFDLDEPARIEQAGDDARGRGPGVRDRLSVRAPDVVDEGGVGDEDPGAHDVVERGARFGESALDDPEAH